MRVSLHLIVCFVLAAFVDAKLFGSKTGVPELSARNFRDEVLYDGNVTAVLFYAPWCGHCQRLASEWKETAKQLRGIAHVTAVNCDRNINKELCARYRVEGYPTIKVFQPAKLTDVDFKNHAADGTPLPKRRPKVYTYNGAREHKAIADFVVSHLRNYVATLDTDDSLQWMAVNKVPRVLMLPGKKYKSRHVSPLFKVLSREYFGKMRFATIPRRVDGAWNLLGMEAPNESQLIYMSDDKSPVVYRGSLKKGPIKRFLDEQYELELNRRRRKNVSIEKESAAQGFEFVKEDPQTEELEHVRIDRQRRGSQLQNAYSAQSEAFARHGKEMPSGYAYSYSKEIAALLGTSSTDPAAADATTTNAKAKGKAKVTTTAKQTTATPVPEEEGAEEAEDFEYAPGSAGDAEEEEEEEEEAEEPTSEAEADEAVKAEPRAAEVTEEDEDAGLDSTVVDLKPEDTVQEGPEAVASYLAKQREEEEERRRQKAEADANAELLHEQIQQQQMTEKALTSGVPKPTPSKTAAGIPDYDTFVQRCLRPGHNCMVLFTKNATRKSDIIVLVHVLESLPVSLRTTILFDYVVVDQIQDPHLKEFAEAMDLTNYPALLWWDYRKQRAAHYDHGYSAVEITRYVVAAQDRKVKLPLQLPPKFLFWLTEREVNSLAEMEKEKESKKSQAAAKDEL